MADIIPDQSISGNKIAGGVVTRFSSTGIQDLATKTALIVTDETITVNAVNTSNLNGNVSVNGNLSVKGSVEFTENIEISKDLTVNGNLTAGVLTVSKIVNADGSSGTGSFLGDTEADLIGKGFHWTYLNREKHLIYREGNRLWSNMSLDLSSDEAFKIDNTTVLSRTALGSSITKSNLQELGELNELVVSGNTVLGEFAFFNGRDLRVGFGTETPNAALEIVDGGANIVFGKAGIGTYSNHDLTIVTDNIPRIVVKNNGEINIGDAVSKNAVVKINGELHVTTIIADTRTERSTPLEFKAGPNSNIYGKGLIWSGTGSTRQLIMMGNPDRLWSSESFEIPEDQCFYIGGRPVLTQGEIGSTVIKSSLTSVGILESLQVRGATQFDGNVTLNGSNGLQTSTITLVDGNTQSHITAASLSTNSSFTMRIQESDALHFSADEIYIGSKTNTRRPVKIFGALSIGINNPDPTLGLSVAGDVSINNKKFVNGTEAPTAGDFRKGDICWNQQPTLSGYVGWICLVDGTPGVWAPFGQIANQ